MFVVGELLNTGVDGDDGKLEVRLDDDGEEEIFQDFIRLVTKEDELSWLELDRSFSYICLDPVLTTIVSHLLVWYKGVCNYVFPTL